MVTQEYKDEVLSHMREICSSPKRFAVKTAEDIKWIREFIRIFKSNGSKH